jgi:hypothetical protein
MVCCSRFLRIPRSLIAAEADKLVSMRQQTLEMGRVTEACHAGPYEIIVMMQTGCEKQYSSIRHADTIFHKLEEEKSTYIKRGQAMSSTCTPIVLSYLYLSHPSVLQESYKASPSPRAERACSLSFLSSSQTIHLLLHNHLRNALSTESLTRSELLLLQTRQRVERRGDQQHHSSRNQARRITNQGEPLDDAHDTVDSGAHVIRLEAADEAVEGFRSWAYA